MANPEKRGILLGLVSCCLVLMEHLCMVVTIRASIVITTSSRTIIDRSLADWICSSLAHFLRISRSKICLGALVHTSNMRTEKARTCIYSMV